MIRKVLESNIVTPVLFYWFFEGENKGEKAPTNVTKSIKWLFYGRV